MSLHTPASSAAFGRRMPRGRVQAYAHPDTHVGWIDIAGPMSPPPSPRSMLAQLRRAHARMPPDIDVVVVDLSMLDEIAIELAVLLCLESRMLGVRDIRLAVALRTGAGQAPGVRLMLERLELWPVTEDQLAVIEQAAHAARRGKNGWVPAQAPSDRGGH